MPPLPELADPAVTSRAIADLAASPPKFVQYIIDNLHDSAILFAALNALVRLNVINQNILFWFLCVLFTVLDTGVSAHGCIDPTFS